MNAGIPRWIFGALCVLALCLLMTGLDARAGDSKSSSGPELLEHHRGFVLSIP